MVPARTHEIRCSRLLPDGLDPLLRAGRAEGFGFVERFVAEWESGENAFDRPGELCLFAWRGDELVGFGGLNVDPYLTDPSVGRVRHVYVVPQARGSGAGGALVREIVRRAPEAFRRLRLFTRQAGPFYEHLGFRRVEEHKASHALELG